MTRTLVRRDRNGVGSAIASSKGTGVARICINWLAGATLHLEKTKVVKVSNKTNTTLASRYRSDWPHILD